MLANELIFVNLYHFSSWYAIMWQYSFLQCYQHIEIFCNSPRKFKSHCHYLWNNLCWGYGWSETLYILCTVLRCFSCVWLFATLWTVPCQAPLSMGFSRQEYWSGVPCPPPGDLPDLGVQAASLASPALADRFFTTNATWGTLVHSNEGLIMLTRKEWVISC